MKLYRFSQAPMHASCYILLQEESNSGILIDPCVNPKKVFSKLGSDLKITHILITHGHFDHISNLDEWEEKTGAEILISRDDSLCLTSPLMNASGSFMIIPKLICKSKPDILLEGGEALELNRIKVDVFSSPGHTPGGLLFLSGNYLFSGDTLFYQGYGRYDLCGGDREELSQTLISMQRFLGKGLILCPGHGEEVDFDRAYTTF